VGPHTPAGSLAGSTPRDHRLTLLSLATRLTPKTAELDAVLERLQELKPSMVMLDIEASDAVPKL